MIKSDTTGQVITGTEKPEMLDDSNFKIQNADTIKAIQSNRI